VVRHCARWNNRKNENLVPPKWKKDIYAAYAEELIKNGWAYYAFDSSEALEQEKNKKKRKYLYIQSYQQRIIRHIALLSKEETESRITNGQSYVIRFKTPVNETLHLQDMIRGDVKFETSLLDKVF
jgi:glutamyl-tRNA synthetase